MRRGVWLLATLVTMAIAIALADAAAPPGRLALSPDGATVWVLSRDGDVTHLDLENGRLIPWTKEEAAPPRFTDIATSADGGTLYALLPSEDGRTTLLLAYRTAAREAISQWEVRGEGRFLAVTSDGARACVIGLKPAAAGGRRAKIAAADWTVTSIDLLSGIVSVPVTPGLQPRSVALLEPAGAPARLLIAAEDRIASYMIDPLRASFFYKSPGNNLDVAAAGASPVLCVLRTGSLAIIDPAKRPRGQGRVQLTDDDATAVVPLPARGRSLAVSANGAVAAVLHEDGMAVTWVDLRAARIMTTEPLGKPQDLMSRRILGGDGGPLRLVMASSTQAAGGASLMTRVMEPPREPPPAPAPEPSPAPVKQAEAAPPPEQQPEHPPEQEPAPVEPKEVVPPPPAPETPAPVQPPRASSEAALMGRLTGDPTGARDVQFFGPNNILKLHARAPVAPDGTFRLPLPPPGRYRVVVSAGPDAHIFTSPEFRIVVVAADQTGLDGIDFEVRGRIK